MAHRMLVFMVLALASPVLAVEPYRDGRVRLVEDGVVLQRASEAGAEQAIQNLPFLPGDRVWTDESGRVEFQFADGSVLRVDRRSKLDYVAQEAGPDGDRIALRLWAGALQLQAWDTRDYPDFEIETPGGLVVARQRGVYRVDVVGAETRLSVYEGEAWLESPSGRVRVAAGERSYGVRGEAPEPASRFDPTEEDSFAAWNAERSGADVWATSDHRYVPDEVAPYAAELESHGTWYNEVEIGHVWRPHVGPDWSPYSNGRWVWTSYGWTWVPYESWGWAPFHFGRWGFSGSLGWYWMPGARWGPAWVSWAVGPRYVGWCPLGRHNRPLVVHGSRMQRSHQPRSWNYVARGDLRRPDVARRRLSAARVRGEGLRLLDSPRTHLDRDLRVSDRPVARRRGVTVTHSPGDTVPELRHDPFTTIPLQRLRGAQDGTRRLYQEQNRAESRRPSSSRSAGGERATRGRAGSARPTDLRSPRPSDTGRSRQPSRTGSQDSDRDVLRRFFGPATRSSGREGARSREAAPRSASPSRRGSTPSRASKPGSSSRSRGMAPRSQSRSRSERPRASKPGSSSRSRNVAPRSPSRSRSTPSRASKPRSSSGSSSRGSSSSKSRPKKKNNQ